MVVFRLDETYGILVISCLFTRFNMIATQGTSDGSRQGSYLPIESLLILFYVQPVLILCVTSLTEILVYSVLEHINTTSMYTVS